jgi:hypothetical protein
MRRPRLSPCLALTLSLLLCAPSLPAQKRKKNKSTEEPKTEVLPLPPELPMALAADTIGLDFHISPLLTQGGLSVQIRQSLNDLIRETRGETIIKLRAFVAGAGDARRVQAQVSQIFTERKLPLPVLSIIQVGALGEERAGVVVEGVVSTRRPLNPNGLAFFAGEHGSSFNAALKRLTESAAAASVRPANVLSCTCFTAQIEGYSSLRSAIQTAFPNAAINLVQPLRNPVSDGTSCEAIGQLSAPPADGPLVWLKSARATLVNSPQLVFTGLQLTFGSFLDDAHEAFSRLQRAAASVQAEVEAPVEVNAFSLDSYAGSALRKSTTVPESTFHMQTIEGLPAIDASAGIEAILAPNVSAPKTLPR